MRFSHPAHVLVYQNITERGCLQCPTTPPPCECSENESCVIIDQSCSACSKAQCVSKSSPSQGSAGVSAGAVAGAVVASVAFLALVAGAFWFYRRRLRPRREAVAAAEQKPDAPARAEDVLNRPDPNEKSGVSDDEQSTIRIYTGASGTINLDPESQMGSGEATDGHAHRGSSQSNPFGDNHSIQTTSTGTQSNVIPIAFVPPASFSAPSQNGAVSTQSENGSGASSAPARPVRSPELDLNLSHMDVSRDNATTASGDGQSQRSGASNHPNRASYLSTGSYASDLLSEAPVIVTPTRGIVKQQVVGLVKAEVIRTSPGVSPTTDGDSLRLQAQTTLNRPPVRSPLAASSFGPSDVVPESAEEDQEGVVRGNPFGDEHSPYGSEDGERSPAPSATTFGSHPRTGPNTPTPSHFEEENGWTPDSPRQPFTASAARPASTHTQAASISGSVIGAEIGGATRVHLGLRQFTVNDLHNHNAAPTTASSGVLNSPRTPYRMTSARLVTTPASGNGGGALEQQQQRAMQEIDPAMSRMSLASVVSTASTRADSILESFPFVPPSPISNRPIRTPPRSPLAQQSFATNNNVANNKTATPPVTPREPPPRESIREAPVSPLPPPPRPAAKVSGAASHPPTANRKALGMSVASQSSTMSNGLGSFPFQIDSGSGAESTSSSPPSSFMGRQRASLDTLALTSDLSSYPLSFDRSRNGPHPPMPPPRS